MSSSSSNSRRSWRLVQVGILLYVLEVAVAGGDCFAEAGEGQVDVLLPLGLLHRWQRFTFSGLNRIRAQGVSAAGVVEVVWVLSIE